MNRQSSLITFLSLSGWLLSFPAGAQDRQEKTRPEAAQQPHEQVDARTPRSFEGRITKAGDKLILQDSATGQGYLLDDQDRAKQFQGKNVKVTATMDPNTSTLHVVDIAPYGR